MNWCKNNIKRNISKVLFCCMLLCCTLTRSVYGMPLDDYEKDPSEIKKQEEAKRDDFINYITGEAGTLEVEGLAKRVEKQGNGGVIKKDDSVDYYIRYYFTPNYYIEDVENSEWIGDERLIDKTIAHKIKNRNGANRWSICGHKKEPQNWLNHNCDIPSFTTGVTQKLASGNLPQGIINGERTYSKSPFNIGVPHELLEKGRGIRGKEKLTGLELYGYELPITKYNGEYDDVEVQNDTRLLANVGMADKFVLAGKTFFAGILNGIGRFFNNFILTPLGFTTKGMSFSDTVVSKLIDTSDLYIAASRQWVRPNNAKTIYNAYYLSDTEVMIRGQQALKKAMQKGFEEEIKKHPRINQLVYLYYDGEHFPVFTYVPTCLETRTVSTPYRDQYGQDMKHETKCVRWETEEEQFARWKKRDDVQDFHNRKAKDWKTIDCLDPSKTYQELLNCYIPKWDKYATKEFDYNNPVMQTIFNNIKDQFLKDNPTYDPKQQISHLVQADDEGKPIGEKLKDYKTIYKAPNTRTREFLREGSQPIRPSIQGGLNGTGLGAITDTRRQLYDVALVKRGINTTEKQEISGSLFRGINVFIIKVANQIIDLANRSLYDFFNMGKLFSDFLKAFKTEVYLPFALIIVVYAAVSLFCKMVLMQSTSFFFKEIGFMILAFAFGIIVLTNSDKLLKLVDYLPNMIETEIGQSIGHDKTEKMTNLCSVDTNENNRVLMCKLWELGVFRPYIHEQWGTEYEALNSDKMTNSNRDLVGDGTVNFGGITTEKNYALYQLDILKSGTIVDPTDARGNVGVIPKTLYKLVDLQAGPNNGVKSDSRYLYKWAGIDTGHTNFLLLGTFIQNAGLFMLVAGFMITKIILGFMLYMKLFMLGFVLISGIIWKRRVKMIGYLREMCEILLLRIACGIFLVISLEFIAEVGALTGNSIQGHEFRMGLIIWVYTVIAFMYGSKFLQSKHVAAISKVSKTITSVWSFGILSPINRTKQAFNNILHRNTDEEDQVHLSPSNGDNQEAFEEQNKAETNYNANRVHEQMSETINAHQNSFEEKLVEHRDSYKEDTPIAEDNIDKHKELEEIYNDLNEKSTILKGEIALHKQHDPYSSIVQKKTQELADIAVAKHMTNKLLQGNEGGIVGRTAEEEEDLLDNIDNLVKERVAQRVAFAKKKRNLTTVATNNQQQENQAQATNEKYAIQNTIFAKKKELAKSTPTKADNVPNKLGRLERPDEKLKREATNGFNFLKNKKIVSKKGLERVKRRNEEIENRIKRKQEQKAIRQNLLENNKLHNKNSIPNRYVELFTTKNKSSEQYKATQRLNFNKFIRK